MRRKHLESEWLSYVEQREQGKVEDSANTKLRQRILVTSERNNTVFVDVRKGL